MGAQKRHTNSCLAIYYYEKNIDFVPQSHKDQKHISGQMW